MCGNINKGSRLPFDSAAPIGYGECMPELVIECTNLHPAAQVDGERLCEAARRVIDRAGIVGGEISITVVDDGRMHEINLAYLQHDYPTDVLSFLLDRRDRSLEGEVIVSADYAAQQAEQYEWDAANELLLYVVHGCLHLVGYDDTTPTEAERMRGAEREILATFGLNPPGRS
jgi:probable rRNA maturation factor